MVKRTINRKIGFVKGLTDNRAKHTDVGGVIYHTLNYTVESTAIKTALKWKIDTDRLTVILEGHVAQSNQFPYN